MCHEPKKYSFQQLWFCCIAYIFKIQIWLRYDVSSFPIFILQICFYCQEYLGKIFLIRNILQYVEDIHQTLSRSAKNTNLKHKKKIHTIWCILLKKKKIFSCTAAQSSWFFFFACFLHVCFIQLFSN